MHERKLEMAKRSCGFICLPGGYGTFEEVHYGFESHIHLLLTVIIHIAPGSHHMVATRNPQQT